MLFESFIVKAHDVLKDPRYLDVALSAGECVWKYGMLLKGPGICHGFAGNGYSLLALFKATGDARWLFRAYQFAIAMFRDDVVKECRTPDHPYSLYEGLAGTVCFLLDLRLRPCASAFPLFEVGGLS